MDTILNIKTMKDEVVRIENAKNAIQDHYGNVPNHLKYYFNELQKV